MTKKTAQSASKAPQQAKKAKREHYLVTGPEDTSSIFTAAGSEEEAKAKWAERFKRDPAEAKAEVVNPYASVPPAAAPAAE